jgi:hypothetical protein
MDAPRPTAAQIAFRRTCAFWKKKILDAGGTEKMYYACLHRYNLPTAAQWRGTPPMEDVVSLFRIEYIREDTNRRWLAAQTTGSAP